MKDSKKGVELTIMILIPVILINIKTCWILELKKKDPSSSVLVVPAVLIVPFACLTCNYIED